MRRFILLVVLAIAACRAKSAIPSCGVVAGQFFRLASEDLAKATVDEPTQRAVSDQLPAMRDALSLTCSEHKWADPVRTCMANAEDHAAFQVCETQLTDAQRKALDQVATQGSGSP
ncbi:hypothetical protein BH11MYX1_BH11MYX1_09550 [soil metagenome]